MALPVDLCNWALLRLGTPVRITSIDPPYPDGASSIPATCGFAYPLVRDAELRAHTWNFARKTVEVAEDGDVPANTNYGHQYRKPSDFLRFINAEQVDWQIEGEFILSNDEAPLLLTYVRRFNDDPLADAALFDPLFNAAMSCQLALQLVEYVTTSNVQKAQIKADYDAAIAEARRVNAIERPVMEPPEDTYISVRR